MKFSFYITIGLILIIETYSLNKYEKYVSGILKQLGTQADHIHECLEPEWKLDKSQDYIQAETEFNNSKDNLNKILKGLTKDIDVNCSNKKELLQFFNEKYKLENTKTKSFLEISLNNLNLRRRRVKSRSKNKIRETGGTTEGTNSTAAAGANNNAAAATNSTKAATAGKEEKNKKKFGAFDDYYTDMENFKSSFKSIIGTPMMTKTHKFLTCYSQAKGTPASAQSIIKQYIVLHPTVSVDMPKLLDGFVNLACQWKPLKEGLEFLMKGNAATDVLQKWEYYGNFVGKFCEALGSRTP